MAEDDDMYNLLLALADGGEAEDGSDEDNKSLKETPSEASEDYLGALAEEAEGVLVENEEEEEENDSPSESERPKQVGGLSFVGRRTAIAATNVKLSTRQGEQSAPKSLGDGVEKYSGIAVKNILYPLVVLHERFAGLVFLKLPQVRTRLGSKPSQGFWATVGILSGKSLPRQSSGGSMFSIWQLSDLQGTTHSLFLFGEAHEHHFREEVGSVCAVFNAKLRQKGGQFSMSLSDHEQLVKLGTAKDLAFCAGKTKNGTQCKNLVDKSVCAYCEFHVQSQLKTLKATGRAQLRDSNLRATLRKAEIAYGGGKGKLQAPHCRPVQPKTKEQIRAAVESLPYDSKSLGAKYVRQVMGLPERQPETKSQPGSRQARPGLKPVGGPLPQRRAMAGNLLPQKRGGLVGGKLSQLKKAATTAGPSNNGAQRGTGPSVKGAPADERSEQGMVTLEVDEIGGVFPDANDFASILGRGDTGKAGPSHAGLLECSIDWDAGKGASEGPQPSGKLAAGTKQLQPSAAGRSKKRQAEAQAAANGGQKRQAVASSHRACLYDEEAGGMVEVDGGESDWLNGRGLMPHERALSVCRPVRPLSTQGIAQKVPARIDREEQALHQSVTDAEARLRAASILKMKQANKEKGLAAAPRDGPTETAEHSCGPPGKAGAGRTGDKAAGREAPASSFYPSGAGAQAGRAGRMYSQALKATAKRPGMITDFTAAFGSLLDRTNHETGSRYENLVEEDEQSQLDKLMTSLQTRDECQRKAELLTKMAVSAFECKTCQRVTESKRPECSSHDVRRVTTTKRWWVCNGCGDHSSTVGVRLRKMRCRRCPSVEFTTSTMRRPAKSSLGSTAGVASRDQMVATVEEAARRESAI